MQNNEEWDLIIEPQQKLFDLGLKKVWNYRDLLWLFVKRDFISFYKQTILGPIWFFIQPLFMMVVYVFVFGRLAQISTGGIPQPLFYLSGITAWTYFSECLLKTSTVLKDNSPIFGKVYFPRLIMPLSIVCSNLVKIFIHIFLLLLIMIYYKIDNQFDSFSINLFYFPLILFLIAIQSLGFGLIVSSLTTKYRDLALLLTFGIQLLMYATPVVYPLSSLSGVTKNIISLNPMSFLMEGFRKSLLGIGEFDIQILCYLAFISFIILMFGVLIFNKVEKNFVDTI